MGRALKNLFAFLLRDAPQHPKLLAFRLQLLEIGQAMEDLLLRLVANGAGVVQDEIGLLHSVDLAIALLQQRPNDLFRVVDVHLTTERLQIESLLRICLRNPRHIAKYSAAKRTPAGSCCLNVACSVAGIPQADLGLTGATYEAESIIHRCGGSTIAEYSGCRFIYRATNGHRGTTLRLYSCANRSTALTSFDPTPFPSSGWGTSVCIRRSSCPAFS